MIKVKTRQETLADSKEKKTQKNPNQQPRAIGKFDLKLKKILKLSNQKIQTLSDC